MLNLLKFLIIINILLFSSSCNKVEVEDDGYRAFLSKATIIGDSENGYCCYLDHGGYVFSRDAQLEGIKRGYFSFSYMESDWTQSPQGIKYIDNAHVRAFNKYCIYNIIRPFSVDDVEAEQIIKNNKNKTPTLWGLGGYCGYIDLNMSIATFNRISKEEINADINLVYDTAKQKIDTLFLQLYYNPNMPSDWSNTNDTYGEISCDISSLATLQQWRDSVVVVVETGDMKEHLTKISRQDFYKPILK